MPSATTRKSRSGSMSQLLDCDRLLSMVGAIAIHLGPLALGACAEASPIPAATVTSTGLSPQEATV